MVTLKDLRDEDLRENALIIVQGSPDQLSPELKARFESIRFLKEIDAPLILGRDRRYALFQGLNLQSWPERSKAPVQGQVRF